MRYPENAPVPYWIKIRSRYLPKIKLKKPPLGTTAALVTVSMILVAFYAVGIHPKIYHEYFQKEQQKTFARLNKNREELANGQRVWSDPFEREKRPEFRK